MLGMMKFLLFVSVYEMVYDMVSMVSALSEYAYRVQRGNCSNSVTFKGNFISSVVCFLPNVMCIVSLKSKTESE